jgi:hypothetical protein
VTSILISNDDYIIDGYHRMKEHILGEEGLEDAFKDLIHHKPEGWRIEILEYTTPVTYYLDVTGDYIKDGSWKVVLSDPHDGTEFTQKVTWGPSLVITVQRMIDLLLSEGNDEKSIR